MALPEDELPRIATRSELIHQTCKKLNDAGVQYGVILAGDGRVNQ
jgi:hypothetical protein